MMVPRPMLKNNSMHQAARMKPLAKTKLPTIWAIEPGD
jgi:hypothetical protein